MTSTTERLMRLLDVASDFVVPDSSAFEWHDESGELDEALGAQLTYQRAQAAALVAIAFLLLRGDELMLEPTRRY